MEPPLPLAEEIAYGDPLALTASWAEDPFTLLFDSAAARDSRSRYSYLCIDPVKTFVLPRAGGSAWNGSRTSPLAEVKAHLASHRLATRRDLPPFQGGAAGLLGYELGGCFERLPLPAARGTSHPDAALAIYDVVVAFDHQCRRAWIVSTGFPEQGEGARLCLARARLQVFRERLRGGGGAGAAPASGSPVDLRWTSDVDGESYMRKVRRAVDYVHAGDVFQVNLSRELSAERPPELTRFDLYRRMRTRTSAPFSAYMALHDDMAICSFSPERFLRVEAGGQVETRPIKGTRPRGASPEDDARLAAELVNSEKDRAENLMIVDLLRNDLSRVCAVGSIEVPQLVGLESFATVHHLVSVVTGRLAPDRDAADLIEAAFPGGSITGAPKIRAMEIIRELEGRRRGPYCGSLCWMGFDGGMDSSILIRTMAVDRTRVRYGVGGGIVADSDPVQEWQETEVKAAAFVAAQATSEPEAHAALSERHAL